MRLLLDTNILIRLGEDKHRIDRATRRLLENAAAVYVSAASAAGASDLRAVTFTHERPAARAVQP
jgi:PIN domain nuclease of toxin-antitoxin system